MKGILRGKDMNVVAYSKEFGVKILVSKTIRKCFYKSQSKLAWRINSYNENLIETYLAKEFDKSYLNLDMDKELQYKKSDVPEKPIWMMWWQGERDAPEIVKCCINSVRRNSNGHRVIVITESNVMEYIKLPEYIYDKFRKGFITRTHLSDIIRLNLLYLYGGAWIDATVLTVRKIPEMLFEYPFYSVNFGKKTKDPSHGRWTAFLLFGDKANEFFKKVIQYHYIYWFNHNIQIDYIIVDYIINYVIKHDGGCRAQIEELPISGRDIFDLDKIMNENMKNEVIQCLQRNSVFYKLSWKHDYQMFKNKEETVYAAILGERFDNNVK